MLSDLVEIPRRLEMFNQPFSSSFTQLWVPPCLTSTHTHFSHLSLWHFRQYAQFYFFPDLKKKFSNLSATVPSLLICVIAKRQGVKMSHLNLQRQGDGCGVPLKVALAF